MTTPMPPDRLKALKKLCDAAKEGPFRVTGDGFGQGKLNREKVGSGTPISIVTDGGSAGWSITTWVAHMDVSNPGRESIDERIATAQLLAESPTAIPELIREVKRQRDEILQLAGEVMRTAGEIIDMKEDEFIAGTHLETEGPHAGWRDTMALGSMKRLGDELVSLGMYERHPDGIHRRWWYRRKASKP